jgi:hypothetical protein
MRLAVFALVVAAGCRPAPSSPPRSVPPPDPGPWLSAFELEPLPAWGVVKSRLSTPTTPAWGVVKLPHARTPAPRQRPAATRQPVERSTR